MSQRISADHSFYARTGKRCIDVVFAMVLVFVFAVPMVILFLAYGFSGGSPLFYQWRIGRGDKPFRLVKFRTLTMDVDKPLLERRFGFGRFMRWSNLDELPQLYNIVRGDMSFIGPRPLPVEYLSLYSEEQRQRHLVRPGITGWAQVNGRHSIAWKDKFSYDVYYVKNLSLWLDLVIIFKTIVLILSFKKDYSLLEKKFTGNHDE